ncbi:cytochrome P450 2D15-like isoform X1 [Saccostrea cucullata]|uniref:cytochrome P450 2D15-like isoform X1 n=2 Tax=Saccostrea cuccullata TaxID=36930 RepID=UPI002ED11502
MYDDIHAFPVSDRDILILGYALYFTSIPVVEVLYWFILYLMYNQDVVVRMHKEIQENVETNKPVTMADQEKLPYCRAVMYEVLRMSFTKVNLSPTHMFSEDLTVNEYTLPKGAWLMAALCTVNLDPNIFPEPEKFKPERFINENGQLFGYENVYSSFSMGPRDCLGKSLAKMEIFLFLTTLVRDYDIENEAGNPLPSLEGTSEGFRVAVPYQVCLKKKD